MQVYIYQAEIYCDDCGSDLFQELIKAGLDTGDSNQFPQGPYLNGGGEADSPQHCGNCGIFLENPLTTDGEEYVQEQTEYAKMAGGDVGPVLAEWKAFYDYL